MPPTTAPRRSAPARRPGRPRAPPSAPPRAPPRPAPPRRCPGGAPPAAARAGPRREPPPGRLRCALHWPRMGELARQRRDWDELAAFDPLWAILTQREKKVGGWDLDEFLATGERE